MATTVDAEMKQNEPLDHLIGVNHSKDLRSSHKHRDKDKENKPSIMAYKYSNNRKGPLHESVILAEYPVFIKYENGQVKVVPHIEDPSRIIRPPRKEEYPYPPYEFANIQEVQNFINGAKSRNAGSLYLDARGIILKYVEQVSLSLS
jgi:hypothetical protein